MSCTRARSVVVALGYQRRRHEDIRQEVVFGWLNENLNGHLKLKTLFVLSVVMKESFF